MIQVSNTPNWTSNSSSWIIRRHGGKNQNPTVRSQETKKKKGEEVAKQAINSIQYCLDSLETKRVKVARLESILSAAQEFPFLPLFGRSLSTLGARADDVNPRSTLIFEEISPSAAVTMASYTFFPKRKFVGWSVGSFVWDRKESNEEEEEWKGGPVEAKFNLPVKEKLKRLSAYREVAAAARKRISVPPDIFKSPPGLAVNYQG